ncbi:hypothetical protein [Streptomyces sp. B29(2018)]|nr:hypothetical protein [Streptomyces sp. B29(2018)]
MLWGGEALGPAGLQCLVAGAVAPYVGTAVLGDAGRRLAEEGPADGAGM